MYMCCAHTRHFFYFEIGVKVSSAVDHGDDQRKETKLTTLAQQNALEYCSVTCTEVKWFWWISESYNSKPQNWQASERESKWSGENENREIIHRPNSSSGEQSIVLYIFQRQLWTHHFNNVHLHIWSQSQRNRACRRRANSSGNVKTLIKTNGRIIKRKTLTDFSISSRTKRSMAFWFQLLTQNSCVLCAQYFRMTTCRTDCDQSRRTLVQVCCGFGFEMVSINNSMTQIEMKSFFYLVLARLFQMQK